MMACPRRIRYGGKKLLEGHTTCLAEGQQNFLVKPEDNNSGYRIILVTNLVIKGKEIEWMVTMRRSQQPTGRMMPCKAFDKAK